MFNKFKRGELVICCGIGKVTEGLFLMKATIILIHYYYNDYLVLLEDGTEEYFNEIDIYKTEDFNLEVSDGIFKRC